MMSYVISFLISPFK